MVQEDPVRERVQDLVGVLLGLAGLMTPVEQPGGGRGTVPDVPGRTARVTRALRPALTERPFGRWDPGTRTVGKCPHAAVQRPAGGLGESEHSEAGVVQR